MFYSDAIHSSFGRTFFSMDILFESEPGLLSRASLSWDTQSASIVGSSSDSDSPGNVEVEGAENARADAPGACQSALIVLK